MEIAAPEADIGMDAHDIIGAIMEAIEAQFIPYKQSDEDKCGQARRKAKNVNQGEGPVF
jgi:hypothetical protein